MSCKNNYIGTITIINKNTIRCKTTMFKRLFLLFEMFFILVNDNIETIGIILMGIVVIVFPNQL